MPDCAALSPGGHYTCSREDCDGKGHVWTHESSAPDDKAG